MSDLSYFELLDAAPCYSQIVEEQKKRIDELESARADLRKALAQCEAQYVEMEERSEERIAELKDYAEADKAWALKQQKRIEELEHIIERQTSRWGEIVDWYETADRSPHSWVELDRIMGDDDAD